MIRWLIAGVLLVGGAAALQIAAPAAGAATVDVAVEDFQFAPASVNVTAGDTVRWTWTGSAPHDVQADDGSFDSGDPVTGGEFSRVFSTAGTFAYYCTVHGAPGGVGMSGVVNVAAAQEPPTATATPAAADETNTPTRTPAATNTVAAGSTAVAATATPVIVANPEEVMPISAPAESGAAGGAGALPSTGTGAGGAQRDMVTLLTAALALAALGAFAGAGIAWARRRS